MAVKREPRPEQPPRPTTPVLNPAAELEELLFTLEICRRALGREAHPEHFERLRRIEGMVRWSLERR